jgi:hypothetical protein
MKYHYTGPVSGVTLADGAEILLMPGAQVELPAAHEYTATLLALGHLAPVQSEAKANTRKKGE